MMLFVPSGAERTRVGLTVSRKVGNAVVRNRVKRRLREAIRRQAEIIPSGFDVVIIAHPQAAEADLESLGAEVADGWNRMGTP
jgi:ribonuclease P protein component